ncbi:MAG TPA: prephenate dehydratase [Candidatus Binatia bacterium]|nr:prephenate dehydratase [Candidatus Binatia bacterium]
MTPPELAADLAGARARIDELDRELQQLIAERARVALRIREIKARSGDQSSADHYRPAREAEVLRRAIERNREIKSPVADDVMARLMREIMSVCLALESPLKVAYLGPEGTYTQGAVYKHFGHAVDARPAAAIDEIFRDVESGAATYGVVPIENSTEGVVSSTLDLLALTPLNICGEVWLPVHHHLLSGGDAASIRRIYAHAQSFAQCRKWLDTKLPGAERVPVASNGLAARMAAEEGAGRAAIAGQAAAEFYKLGIVFSNIEDDPNNTTRFLVIGRQNPEPTGRDSTSLMMSAHRNQSGALFQLLEPFAQAGISLTKIESRPSRREAWDYNFFVDLEGHQADARIRPALDTVRTRAAYFRILGSYPRAVV